MQSNLAVAGAPWLGHPLEDDEETRTRDGPAAAVGAHLVGSIPLGSAWSGALRPGGKVFINRGRPPASGFSTTSGCRHTPNTATACS